MANFEDVLYKNLFASLLFGVYDVLQAARAPISQDRITNKFNFEDIPEGLANEEAIAWFAQKEVIPSDVFARMDAIAKARSFSIATGQDLVVIGQIKQRLDSALAHGVSFGQWKKEIAGDLANKIGITFKNKYHIENVFRTNMQTAYNAGRFVQMEQTKTLRPFLQYNAVDDSRTRDEHLAMNGIVRPFDDPQWEIWTPPNGFGCRCVLTSLSKFEVDRDNIDTTREIKDTITNQGGVEVPLQPDAGFSINSAKAFLER